MDWLTQLDPDTIKMIVDLLDISVKFFTVLAIIFGAFWTYFHYFRGRIYSPRLELDIDLDIKSKDNSYYIRAKIAAKNVGLSCVNLHTDVSALTFSQCEEMGEVEDAYTVDSKEIGCFDVFMDHERIESDETIRDQCVVVMPRSGKEVAFKVDLRVVSTRRSWLFQPKGEEWNEKYVEFVDILQTKDK